MKWKLKAIWRILTCKGFYVATRNKKGELYRDTHGLYVRDANGIVSDLECLVEAEESVAAARSIINATK